MSSVGEKEELGSGFELLVHGLPEWDQQDDNVDVEVRFSSGRRFAATFFTVNNVRTLLRRYARSGECASGLYVWASDMILVETLTLEVVDRTIRDLIETGEIFGALTELEPLDALEDWE